jgi:dipeptidyl aminopeptidase/acylaminoacyl peptidase
MKPTPYGTWRSPITADLICAQSVRISEPRIGAGGALYWIESRPADAGRSVLVHHANGEKRDITPAPFSVRSRVHEYGGGAAAIDGDTVYFVNETDQRVYRQTPGADPQALTPSGACRYGDLVVDGVRGRLIAVAEDHAAARVNNRLVAIDCRGRTIQVLAAGADFYSSPRLSPDGSRLAWLQWNHPEMPWDAAELWTAELGGDGVPCAARRLAGGASESVFQPEFSPRNVLHFVSDRDGWWNLYRHDGDAARALTRERAEFGRPQWQFNQRTYGFADPDTLIASFVQDGLWHLAEVSSGGKLRVIKLPYTSISQVDATAGRALLLAASPQAAEAVVEVDLATGMAHPVEKQSATTLAGDWLSIARPLSYATHDGGRAHALYYPPHNPQAQASRGERPPLLVWCHGGPTAASDSALDLRIQYWTSRGFAVLDVNYRGSSGYGREYRRQLYGLWGIVDVIDCLDGARHLVRRGEADSTRLAIRGGSAGGYTALAALTFHKFFTAGASYYGIADLETAMTDTHKFESRYGDRLLGPYPAARALYRERSPLHAAGRLNCPVIFFQGLKDKVVPPDQAERMAAALTAKGVPVAYLTFANESHGFRAAATIRTTLEAELYFYSRVFGFEPADALPGVIIRNSDAL